MDFLNHREGVMVFCQVFLLSPLQCNCDCRNCKRLREFEEMEISSQSCGDDIEQQEENSVPGFRPRNLPQFSSPEHMLKTPSALKSRTCAMCMLLARTTNYGHWFSSGQEEGYEGVACLVNVVQLQWCMLPAFCKEGPPGSIPDWGVGILGVHFAELNS